MPIWKRIIVGDVFKLSPGGFNYYRDLFLLWPFFLFSIVAVANSLETDSAHRAYAFNAAICAAVAILLAKERLFLLVALLALVAVRLGIALIFVHELQIVIVFLICTGVLIAIVRSRNLLTWRPSYVSTEGMNLIDLLVGVSGLVATIAISILLRR